MYQNNTNDHLVYLLSTRLATGPKRLSYVTYNGLENENLWCKNKWVLKLQNFLAKNKSIESYYTKKHLLHEKGVILENFISGFAYESLNVCQIVTM